VKLSYSIKIASVFLFISFSCAPAKHCGDCTGILNKLPEKLEPLPQNLPLLSEQSFSLKRLPVYCGESLDQTKLPAPYDLVVNSDGNKLFWIGEREYIFKNSHIIAKPQRIYTIDLLTKESKRLTTDSVETGLLECEIGDNIEIDKENNLYFSAPYTKKIYSFSPDTEQVNIVTQDIFDPNIPEVYLFNFAKKSYGLSDEKIEMDYITNLFLDPSGKIYYLSFVQKDETLSWHLKSSSKNEKSSYVKISNFFHLSLMVNPGYLLGPNISSYAHLAFNKSNQLFASSPSSNIISFTENRSFSEQELSNLKRLIPPTSESSGFLGTGASGMQNGPIKQASFSSPQGIFFNSSGDLYIADTGNYAIRKVTKSGTVSTVFQIPEKLRKSKNTNETL
jgi:hypothetical protein